METASRTLINSNSYFSSIKNSSLKSSISHNNRKLSTSKVACLRSAILQSKLRPTLRVISYDCKAIFWTALIVREVWLTWQCWGSRATMIFTSSGRNIKLWRTSPRTLISRLTTVFEWQSGAGSTVLTWRTEKNSTTISVWMPFSSQPTSTSKKSHRLRISPEQTPLPKPS